MEKEAWSDDEWSGLPPVSNEPRQSTHSDINVAGDAVPRKVYTPHDSLCRHCSKVTTMRCIAGCRVPYCNDTCVRASIARHAQCCVAPVSQSLSVWNEWAAAMAWSFRRDEKKAYRPV